MTLRKTHQCTWLLYEVWWGEVVGTWLLYEVYKTIIKCDIILYPPFSYIIDNANLQYQLYLENGNNGNKTVFHATW